MIAAIKKVIWVAFLIATFLPLNILAFSGTPQSNTFGYGVRINLEGIDLFNSIREAGKYHLDWIAFDLSWQNHQADSSDPFDWQMIDGVMNLAADYHLSVLVSIIRAPYWAIDQNGPNPEKTGHLVSNLVSRYPDTLMAIEIFPSANTTIGWGTTPNPKAYTQLLRKISITTHRIHPNILIVGAGLTFVNSSDLGVDDLSFLRQLYAEGIAEYMPILGIRFPPIGSTPLNRTNNSDILPLRHYEDIRNVMTENGHKNGLIWITGFSWDRQSITRPDEQAAWVKQAYLLFRSQLYIGTAFFDCLNSFQEPNPALLGLDGTYHPGFEELIQIIALDHNKQTIIITSDLYKKLTQKNCSKATKL